MSKIEFISAQKCDGSQFVTIFSPLFKRPLVAASDHPNFDLIVEELEKSETEVADIDALIERVEGLVDRTVQVAKAFERVTDRVSVATGIVTFDNDPVDNSITKQILRFIEEGESCEPLALFMEKLYQNPNEHSREQLYDWLAANEFSISEDGDIACYKGVNDDYTSWHNGPAIVDGQHVEHCVNKPGTTVEMPRSDVAHNPKDACSSGLHASNHRYAGKFGSRRVEIRVNPRDVVSVPTDAGGQKMRVCRYYVMDDADKAHEGVLVKATVAKDAPVVKTETPGTDPEPKPAEVAADTENWYDAPTEGQVIRERGKKDRPAREIVEVKRDKIIVKKEGDESGKTSKIKRKNLKRYDLV